MVSPIRGAGALRIPAPNKRLQATASSGARSVALGGLIIGNDAYARGGEMKYKILLQQSEEGFSVSCPGLPGCWSQGATEQEAIENIRDAIQEYLAAIAESLKDADVREIEVSV